MPTHQGLAAGLADQNFRSKVYGADSAGNLRFSYSLEGCVPHTPRVPVLEVAWSSSLPCAGYYLVKLQKGPFSFFLGGGRWVQLSGAFLCPLLYVKYPLIWQRIPPFDGKRKVLEPSPNLRPYIPNPEPKP